MVEAHDATNATPFTRHNAQTIIEPSINKAGSPIWGPDSSLALLAEIYRRTIVDDLRLAASVEGSTALQPHFHIASKVVRYVGDGSVSDETPPNCPAPSTQSDPNNSTTGPHSSFLPSYTKQVICAFARITALHVTNITHTLSCSPTFALACRYSTALHGTIPYLPFEPSQDSITPLLADGSCRFNICLSLNCLR